MHILPSPRPRSSSAGVLGKNRDKDKPDGDGYFHDSRYPLGGKGAESSTNERGCPGYHYLLQCKGRVSPTMVAKLIPVLAKILSRWGSIIQKGTSCTMPLVALEGMLVYYLTSTINLWGVRIGIMYSCDWQQALVGNMTSWPGGGLSREDWEQ